MTTSRTTKPKMRADEFVPIFKHDHLKDGTWIVYFRGRYDSRDIMSDCVRPIWAIADECKVAIIPHNRTHSSDYVFQLKTDRACGNYVASLIRQGKFENLGDIIGYFHDLCTALGTLEISRMVRHGTITLELWDKYKQSQEVNNREKV